MFKDMSLNDNRVSGEKRKPKTLMLGNLKNGEIFQKYPDFCLFWTMR